MDISSFADDNFDPKKFINDTFKGQDQEKREQFASSMVMKLQLAIQEVNSNLEDTSQQVLSGLPRVIRDVESLGQEASLVKTQMASLMADVQAVSLAESNSSSLDTLVRLDAIKHRLSQSAQALKQADNWTTLANEVEEVLDSGDLEAAANKVVQLQRCLSVLSQTPDSEDRAALINSFQLRIEAMASPHVVEAFTHLNLSESMKYSRILHMIGLDAQLLGYYHQCIITGLSAAWNQQCIEAGAEVAAHPVYLTAYYDKLSTLLQKQMSWIGEVFPDADPKLLLCQLAAAALTELDPPISEVVNSSAKLQEDPVQYICEVRAAMDHFLKQFQHIVGDASLSSNEYHAHLLAVTEAVYAPLAPQLLSYSQYESTALVSHLTSANILTNTGSSSSDVADTLLRIRQYCGKMRQQSEQTVERCKQMSGLIACQGLIEAVSTYVSGVLSLLTKACDGVKGLQQDIKEDWTVFGTCLDLIHTAGLVLVTVEECSEVISKLVEDNSQVLLLSSDKQTPLFMLSPAVLLNEEQRNALKTLVEQLCDENCPMIDAIISKCSVECCACVKASLTTITSPLRAHLKTVPDLSVWSGNTQQLPSTTLSAAFSPQEYVTQMGQYLLTLPQHLEPLLVSPSPALNRALQQLAVQEGMQHPGQRAVSESEVSAADFMIGRVAHSTCSMYADTVMKIEHLQEHSTTQLITDVEYVINILEDLGVGTCEPLDSLLALLKASPQQYSSVSEGLKGGTTLLRMVAAVRQMRNISATS